MNKKKTDVSSIVNNTRAVIYIVSSIISLIVFLCVFAITKSFAIDDNKAKVENVRRDSSDVKQAIQELKNIQAQQTIINEKLEKGQKENQDSIKTLNKDIKDLLKILAEDK